MSLGSGMIVGPRAALLAAALWGTGAVAQGAALDFPPPGAEAARQNLTLALTQADGSVDVVLAGEPGPEELDGLLSLLVIGTADQVRFSTTYDMPGRREAMDAIEAFAGERGLAWAVCRDWWLSPDADYLAGRVRDDFGGSVVFIDNGRTSDAVDNPDADLAAAMREDPAFVGVLGPEPERVEDTSVYLDAVSAVWVQIVPTREVDAGRQERGGWTDGC